MRTEPDPERIKDRVRRSHSGFFTIVLIFLMTAAMIPGVTGTPAIDLGSACSFTILAKTGITTTGGSTVIGDMGVSPIAATSITGFALTMDPLNQFSTSSQVAGKVYAADYNPPTPGMMTNAINSMEAAYTDGAGRSPTSASYVDVGGGDIGGKSLIPGVYKWSTGVVIPTDVTLAGGPDDIWILIIPGTLDLSSGSHVILSGGAQAKNVFWIVGGVTTLKPYSAFNGNILDQTKIALQTGATLHGKAFAQTEVTLDTATVDSSSTCTMPEYIVLSPLTATNTIGETHTVTALVRDAGNNPVPGKSVTFAITAGPDTGTTGTGITDLNGQVTFSYAGSIVGTDTIIASFVDTTGATILSNEVTKTWTPAAPVAKSIVLSPVTATNTVGQTHTVTALVTDTNSNPFAGESVTFEITAGPDTGTTGTGVTDINGQAIFSYVGTGIGTDTIVASFVNTTGVKIKSNEVTGIWVQVTPVAKSIVLSPVTATNTIGQTHTVTALVTDTNGNPFAGQSVTFEITAGPDTGTTGTGVTDANGQVTFSYTGSVVGTDTIVASFVNTNGVKIKSNEVTKIWEQGTPVPEFPTVFVLVGVLMGIMFIIHSIRRK